MSSHQKQLIASLTLIAALLLSACGGGGGDSTTPTNNSNWDSLVWDQDNWAK